MLTLVEGAQNLEGSVWKAQSAAVLLVGDLMKVMASA